MDKEGGDKYPPEAKNALYVELKGGMSALLTPKVCRELLARADELVGVLKDRLQFYATVAEFRDAPPGGGEDEVRRNFNKLKKAELLEALIETRRLYHEVLRRLAAVANINHLTTTDEVAGEQRNGIG